MFTPIYWRQDKRTIGGIGLDTRSKQARLAIKLIKKVDFGVIQEKIHRPSNLYAEVSLKPGLTGGSLELSDLNLTPGNLFS